MTDKKVDFMMDIWYPSSVLKGGYTRKQAMEITQANLEQISTRIVTLQSQYPDDYWEKSAYHSLFSVNTCWQGVRNWLEGDTDWDSARGINNPFITESAWIKE